MLFRIKIIAILVCFHTICLGNTDPVHHFFFLLKTNQYQEARQSLVQIENPEIKNQLNLLLGQLWKGDFDVTPDIKTSPKSEEDSHRILILSYLNKGIYEYLKQGNEIKAFRTLKNGLDEALSIDDQVLVCEFIKYILEIYERFNAVVGDKSHQYFLSEYRKYAYDDYEKSALAYYKYRILQRYDYTNSEELIAKFSDFESGIDSASINYRSAPLLRAKIDITEASYYENEKEGNDLDKAKRIIETVIKEISKKRGYLERERLIAAKIILAAIYFDKKPFSTSLNLLNAINIDNNDYLFELLDNYISYWKYRNHEALENNYECIMYYSNYLEREVYHQQAKNLQLVADFETKHQAEKKALENLQLKKDNQNLLIGGILLLILGSVIALLFQNNTTKKRKIAEQQQELEKQKVETLIKEQELVSIDAMIAGQEKERLRVANELHDDLGSLMATIKLHFDNIKVNKEDPALKHAHKLLDQAYQKIRGISHAKNSGVMASQGLLPAVQKMARNITATNALKVKVLDFGLEDRMENSLELTIFRIIQELITNVVKHADATKISVQFTQHEDSLNLIVEDNGSGFDVSTIKASDKGIGLNSIEKRIEHLKGVFTIESIKNRGTTIIIDIPT